MALTLPKRFRGPRPPKFVPLGAQATGDDGRGGDADADDADAELVAPPPPRPSPSPPPDCWRRLFWKVFRRRSRRDLQAHAVEACYVAQTTIQDKYRDAVARVETHRRAMATAVAAGRFDAAKAALRSIRHGEQVQVRYQAQLFAVETQLQVLQETATNHDVLRSMKRVNTAMRHLGRNVSVPMFERHAASLASHVDKVRECTDEWVMGADEWTEPFDDSITDEDVLAALRDGTMDGHGGGHGTVVATATTVPPVSPVSSPPPTHASVAIQTGDTATVAREGGTTGPVDVAASTLAALAASLPDPPTGPARTRTDVTTATTDATDATTTEGGDVQLL